MMANSTPFAKIETFFHNDKSRSIDELARIYSDMDRVKRSVERLTKEHLTIDLIQNKRILVKPNWVRHPHKPEDRYSLCTHENVLLALIDTILPLKPSQIVIGDAPIQGCQWDKLLTARFYREVELRQKVYGTPVRIKDFRRVVFDTRDNALTNRQTPNDFIIFDLGSRSFLEPVTHPTDNQFRVTVYNPDRFLESHRPGVHKYCITREVFDADLIISVPKIKTHQKSGITSALKNIVGINGDKDFLPHHRLGGTLRGGDCYPGRSIVRYTAELCYDQANRNRGNWKHRIWQKLAAAIWHASRPGPVHQIAAGWYGNDTTWRMVMDLNLIMQHGTKEGKLSNSSQRTLFSLCDGIIGGQGNGPLEPEPLDLGVITFSNNSALNDICCATLMQIDIDRIPLLAAAANTFAIGQNNIFVNGNPCCLSTLKSLSTETKMPPGWIGYRENAPIVDFDRLMTPLH